MPLTTTSYAILGLLDLREVPEDARARAIAMYVYMKAEDIRVWEKPRWSEVGRAFNRDRTTVRHAFRRVHDWINNERNFALRLSQVQQRVAAIGYPGGVL